MVPEELKYTKEHEWVKVEGNKVKFGVTDYAQHALGDVVFVELPAIGDSFGKGDSFGVVESVKAVSDCYAPVGGAVTAVNEALLDSPELLNSDPYGDGWMVEIEMDNPAELAELMDAAAYACYLKEVEEGEE
jgi:glycine cleavage system H protein